MIILTRLGGHELAVNPDLIERAEPTPDTVLTMIDGHKIVVSESVPEVVELVRTWRAQVAAQAYTLSRDAGLRRAIHTDPLDAATAGGDGAHEARADDEMSDHAAADEMGEHVAVEASLARVLRLPQRGE